MLVYTLFQNYETEPKIDRLTCHVLSYTITKLKLFKVSNKQMFPQEILLIIIAKVRLHIYLFTFLVAIIAVEICKPKLLSTRSRCFENGYTYYLSSSIHKPEQPETQTHT